MQLPNERSQANCQVPSVSTYLVVPYAKYGSLLAESIDDRLTMPVGLMLSLNLLDSP